MKKMIGIVMMITGGILLIGGYFLYGNKEDALAKESIEEQIQAIVADGVFTERERVHIDSLADKHNLDKEELITDINTRISVSHEDAETEVINQAKKKGDDFEKFIVKKFNHKYFKIKQWAGDKYVDGIYSEKTLQPDIIVEFNHKNYSQIVAVECKYRSEVKNDNVEISYKDQLARYKQFEKEEGNDVYIALGIGGKASAPKDLYLIPLKKISSTTVSIQTLEKFKKDVNATFFLNVNNGILNIQVK